MLKNIGLLLVFLSSQAIASEFISIHEIPRDLRSYEMAWSAYKTDDCTMLSLGNGKELQQRGKGFRRCLDGSPSFVQPASTGLKGWEGKCGQTLASNMVYSLCKKVVSPDKYFTPVLRDITPGVLPRTFRRGLIKTFPKLGTECPLLMGRWSSNSYSQNDFVDTVIDLTIPKYSHRNQIEITRQGLTYKRNPVGILIQNPGGNLLHWVMVIDVLEQNNQCSFIINHWDNQYSVPCDQVKKWSGNVGRTYPIVLKSYSVVSYN
jgi:hypothetical protein